jgi:monoamine oxidase
VGKRLVRLNTIYAIMSSKPQSSVLTHDPHNLWSSRPIFSHVASTTGPVRLVATAGQVGADAHRKVPEDLDEQIALAFRNLSGCLEAAGATVTDVYKLVYYIVDYDPANRRHSPILKAWLNGHRPATTLVPVHALAEPAFKFEVEAYAAVRIEETRDIDVLVVGAGLSGLTAAHKLQQAGLNVVVVEARDRVGGKTHSVDPLGGGRFIDVGAAWINDTNQAKAYELAKKLNLELVMQRTQGSVIQEDLAGKMGLFAYGGTPSNASEPNGIEQMVFIRELFEKLCQEVDIHNPVGSHGKFDTVSLLDWCKSETKSETAAAAVNLWTRAMLGLEASEISALYFLDYCKSGGGLMQMRADFKHGGQYLRFIRGESTS